MKKIIFLVLFLAATITTYSQVAVNTDNSLPDNSAMLDVKSDTAGVLIPRMTTTQRDAISSPATGLIVFVTTDNAFYYYNSNNWVKILNGTNTDDDWTINGSNMYSGLSGNVGIGVTDPTTKLFVRKTNKKLTYPVKFDNQDHSINEAAVGILFSTGGGGSARGKGALVYQLTDTWNRGSFHFLQHTSPNSVVAGLKDAVLTIQNNGFVGFGTTLPLSIVHIKNFDLSLKVSAIDNGDLIIEDDDAGLGIYSNIAGNGGSFIDFGEIKNGSFTNKWSVYRTTEKNDNSNQLRFAFGTNADFLANQMVLTLDKNGNVGVGTSTPEESAALEVSSSSKGLLPPRMTEAQRDAISNPAEGLMLYNTDDKELQYFDGNLWRDYYTPSSSKAICGNKFIDLRDGKMYNSVKIGSQCWMAENLNVGIMLDTTSINQTDNGIIEKYCYDNEITNCDTYGGMYQWNEMMQYVTTESTQGICPDGWHIPDSEEWAVLELFLGMTQEQVDSCGCSRGTNEGGKLKEHGTSHWYNPNTGATNVTGFTALPAGAFEKFIAINNRVFHNIGIWTKLWTSTLAYFPYGTKGIYRSLEYHGAGIACGFENIPPSAYSVRCIRD